MKMKDKKHIKSFNEVTKNLNISDVSDSKNYYTILENILNMSDLQYIKSSDMEDVIYKINRYCWEEIIKLHIKQ